MNINELSQEEFNALTPDQIRERASKEAEQSDDTQDAEDDIDPSEVDEQEEDNQEESTEDGDDDQSDDDDVEDEPSEDDDGSVEDVEQVEDETPAEKPKKKGKQTQADTTTTDATLDPTDFQSQVTAAFKAAGKEYSFSDPKEIISLMQKGVAFTQKSQQLSHLKGLNEILTQNGLTDPAELAFLIDVKNGKPEAVAKLIQQHQIDTYDLDEDKASAYQASSVDIDGHARAVALQELVAENQNDPNFSAVFAEARTWDDLSQEHLANNPSTLEVLRDQKSSGMYDKIISEINRRNVVNPSKLPIMQQYIQIGTELFGGSGSAQNTQIQQPTVKTKERVIVKRSNVDEQRKRVAPIKQGSARTSSAKVRDVADLNNLSQSEFDKLTPEQLRRMK